LRNNIIINNDVVNYALKICVTFAYAMNTMYSHVAWLRWSLHIKFEKKLVHELTLRRANSFGAFTINQSNKNWLLQCLVAN